MATPQETLPQLIRRKISQLKQEVDNVPDEKLNAHNLELLFRDGHCAASGLKEKRKRR